MVQVVIQPSTGSPASRSRWQTTMVTAIPFAEESYRRHLTDAELNRLIDVHPDGQAVFWAAKPEYDEKMAARQTGDVVLFTGQMKVHTIGTLGVPFQNAAFADRLWTPDPGSESWHNVYSVIGPQPVDIHYSEIWALPGFNERDVFQQIRFLDEEKGQLVLTGLRIELPGTEQEDARADAEAIRTLTGSRMSTEAVNTTTTSYERGAGTVRVHRAEALLVQDYVATLDETKAVHRFATPDGGIADLLVVGPDGTELIEAKRSPDRTFVRNALGQLLDYAPHADPAADRLAVLLPDEPDRTTVDLLHRYGIDCIHRTGPGRYRRLPAGEEERSHLRKRWLAEGRREHGIIRR